MLEKEDIISQIRVQTDVIDTLLLLKERILKAHKKHSVGKTVGSSVSIGGAVATIGGIFLAPFTAGISLGLTVGGIASTVVGAGTSLTTGIIQTIKTKEWAEELMKTLTEHEKELTRIGEKIVKHPDWIDYTLLAGKGGKFLLSTTPATVEVGKIVKYLVIMAPHYGIDKAAAHSFAVSNVPGAFVLTANDMLVKNVAQSNVQLASNLKIGLTAFKALSVGIAAFGIGLDIYTIVDTWANKPGAVKQIDEIVSELEESRVKLLELVDEFED